MPRYFFVSYSFSTRTTALNSGCRIMKTPGPNMVPWSDVEETARAVNPSITGIVPIAIYEFDSESDCMEFSEGMG